MQLSVGQTAFDSFEVLEHLGVGGMGSIYKARHILMDRVVVLKVLGTGQHTSENIIRFQNEARLLSQLKHPNIAQIFDFGVSKDGEPYLAIEFYRWDEPPGNNFSRRKVRPR